MLFRRIFSARAEIDAPTSVVWQLLTDLPRYAEWNPFCVEAKSSLSVGDPIEMRVNMRRNGKIVSQREWIREVVPERRLRWGMSLGARAILEGERDQRLESVGDRTRYETDDLIAGALAPIVFAIYAASIQEGFEEMTRALKVEAERRAIRT
jgi:hypothetical protein